MKHLLSDYKEYSVIYDGKPIVYFFNSGLCLDHSPKMKSCMHSHYHAEIFTVFRGEMTVVTERGTDIIKAGETVIIPPFLMHQTLYTENIFRVTIAFLHPKGDLTQRPLHRRLHEISNSENVVLYNTPSILNTFDRLLNYTQGDFHFKEQLILSTLSELTVLLCQRGESQQTSYPKVLDDDKNYRRYIIRAVFDRAFSSREFPIKAPTLGELSEYLHLSTKQTERAILIEFGRSFQEEITHRRITKAQELLLNSTMTVNKIALAVGYTVTRGFFTAFSKKCGMTPGQYRAMYRSDLL